MSKRLTFEWLDEYIKSVNRAYTGVRFVFERERFRDGKETYNYTLCDNAKGIEHVCKTLQEVYDNLVDRED